MVFGSVMRNHIPEELGDPGVTARFAPTVDKEFLRKQNSCNVVPHYGTSLK